MAELLAEARGLHFVGSYGVEGAGPNDPPNPDAAMRAMLTGAEDLPLYSLPSGETGPEQLWVGDLIGRLTKHPGLEVVQAGDFHDYDHTTMLAIREGHTLAPESLSRYLGYAGQPAVDAWSALQEVREEYGRPDLPLQRSVINPLDASLFSIKNFMQAMGSEEVFRQATADQMTALHEQFGDDVVAQIESPAAFGFAVNETGGHRVPQTMEQVAGHLAELIGSTPDGLRWGLHLCLGDMNNETRDGRPLESGTPVVRLSQAIADALPKDRLPEYIHFPIAGGKSPALEDPEIYAELSGLNEGRLADIRFIAGLVHESTTKATLLSLHRQAEGGAQRTLDVATPCGMARGRSPETVARLTRHMAWLAHRLAE